jgi:hypothetical protein
VAEFQDTMYPTLAPTGLNAAVHEASKLLPHGDKLKVDFVSFQGLLAWATQHDCGTSSGPQSTQSILIRERFKLHPTTLH